jgi:hypothetical protein
MRILYYSSIIMSNFSLSCIFSFLDQFFNIVFKKISFATCFCNILILICSHLPILDTGILILHLMCDILFMCTWPQIDGIVFLTCLLNDFGSNQQIWLVFHIWILLIVLYERVVLRLMNFTQSAFLIHQVQINIWIPLIIQLLLIHCFNI